MERVQRSPPLGCNTESSPCDIGVKNASSSRIQRLALGALVVVFASACQGNGEVTPSSNAPASHKEMQAGEIARVDQEINHQDQVISFGSGFNAGNYTLALKCEAPSGKSTVSASWGSDPENLETRSPIDCSPSGEISYHKFTATTYVKNFFIRFDAKSSVKVAVSIAH